MKNSLFVFSLAHDLGAINSVIHMLVSPCANDSEINSQFTSLMSLCTYVDFPILREKSANRHLLGS